MQARRNSLPPCLPPCLSPCLPSSPPPYLPSCLHVQLHSRRSSRDSADRANGRRGAAAYAPRTPVARGGLPRTGVRAAVCCSVLQRGAAWCSVVQHGAAWCSMVLVRSMQRARGLCEEAHLTQMCVGCEKVSCILLHGIICVFSHPAHLPHAAAPLYLRVAESLMCSTAWYRMCILTPYTPVSRSWSACALSLLQRRVATHCNTLPHTATHCNILQHNVIHCNALEHTATHHTAGALAALGCSLASSLRATAMVG